MEETSRTLSKSPVYDLLKGEKAINLTQNAPITCIQQLETLGKEIRTKCVESAKKEGRVTIKPRDVQKAIEFIKVSASNNEETRLAFAQVHRFFEADDDIKVSEDAVNLYRNFLEELIKQIGNVGAKIVESQGRKTIDDTSIQRAFLTFIHANKISYIDFVSQIFSADEIRSICVKENLPTSATKQDLAKKLYSSSVSLERMLAPFQFQEIQARMLKLSFPVPLHFQHVFSWVEDAPIAITQTPSLTATEIKSCAEEKPVVSAAEASTKEDIQEEQNILEKNIDYKSFLDKESRLVLRQIIDQLIPIYRLENIAMENELSIDVSEGKESAIDQLLKTGISIIHILNELTSKDLSSFLKIFFVKTSGSKKELIQRLLNSVDFADYDVTHQDLILLLQGKEFLKNQDEKKKQNEVMRSKIRNYSGSIKLDVLKILDDMGFKGSEKDLKEKYVQSGREAVSFFGVIGGLLRDGIVQVKPFEEETFYEVPENVQPIVKSALEEINKLTKELEGVVSSLPNSALILLSHVCGFGEAIDLFKVKEKFFQVYTSSETWNKARQLLKERKLVEEKYDETLEQNVIYSPKLICPILSGILVKKKKDILQAEQEQYKEETKKTGDKLDFSGYSEGVKTLLYVMVNSNGSVEKGILKTSFTSPPGLVYSENSFFRFVKILKDDKVISEEKDQESGETYLSVTYKDLGQLRAKLEGDLFEDIDLGEKIENLPESTLGLLKIIVDNGGTILLTEMRQTYMKYYSSTTFYKGFHLLDEICLSEGISNNGEYIIVVPGIYLTNIEQYFRTHPVTMKEQAQKALSPEDFILNAFNPKKLIYIALAYGVKEDQEHLSIVKQLLYEKNVPFIPLAADLISKQNTIQFCMKNHISTTGSRNEMLKRIIEAGVIILPEGTKVDGELKKEEQAPEQEPITPVIELDKDILLESIEKIWDKQGLVDIAKQLNVRVSGNKLALIEEIFFESDLGYAECIEKLVKDDVLATIKQQTGNASLVVSDIVQMVKSSNSGFPVKNRHVRISQILECLSKAELSIISQTFGGRSDGMKAAFVNEISGKITNAPDESINTILRKVPDWPSRVQKNLNVNIKKTQPALSIIALIGSKPTAEPKKEIVEPEKKPVDTVKTPAVSSKKPDATVKTPVASSKKHADTVKPLVVTSKTLDDTVKTPNVPAKKPKEAGAKVRDRSFHGFVEIIKNKFAASDYEAGFEDLNITSLDKLVPETTEQFLRPLGKGFLKNLVKYADLPLDVTSETTVLIKRILAAFKIEAMELDAGLVKKVANLKIFTREKIPNGLTFFAQGNLLSAFDTIKNEDNSLGMALSKEFAPIDLESPNLKGVFFEASVFQALLSLTTDDTGHGIKKVIPTADADNFQRKAEEPDGKLKIKILQETLQDYFCIYDCKAYSKSYHPVDQLLQLLNYIKLEDTKSKARAEDRTWKFIILFGYSFAYKESVLKEKLQRELGDYKIILWEAKALRELWRANLYSQGKIKRELDWEKIFRPKDDVIIIQEDMIKRLIDNANEEIKKKTTDEWK